MAASVRGEAAIGWAFHYSVGIAWAALYVAITKLGFGSGPTFISALAVSLALLVAPWFIMQPALGLGFMAAHAQACRRSRRECLRAHGFRGRPLPRCDWLGLGSRRAVGARWRVRYMSVHILPSPPSYVA